VEPNLVADGCGHLRTADPSWSTPGVAAAVALADAGAPGEGRTQGDRQSARYRRPSFGGQAQADGADCWRVPAVTIWRSVRAALGCRAFPNASTTPPACRRTPGRRWEGRRPPDELRLWRLPVWPWPVLPVSSVDSAFQGLPSHGAGVRIALEKCAGVTLHLRRGDVRRDRRQVVDELLSVNAVLSRESVSARTCPPALVRDPSTACGRLRGRPGWPVGFWDQRYGRRMCSIICVPDHRTRSVAGERRQQPAGAASLLPAKVHAVGQGDPRYPTVETGPRIAIRRKFVIDRCLIAA
jgi:hypothetical protein